ncbi:MAG TPA: HEAT repeat domain-containing protein [Planctomycetaceae bacterium]|nr:HEAT repeat domain-containing protein [Planctomycetaceae bacterium]
MTRNSASPLRLLPALVLAAMEASVALGQVPDPAGAAPAAAAPVDESPLLVEPKTPEEQFRATLLMLRLARPNVARLYLEQFMAGNPDDDLVLKLRDEYGPATFIRLHNAKELRPLSTRLLDQVNEAFRRRGADPDRINRLVDDLSGPPAERAAALSALRDAGTVVVPHMIRRLGTAGDERRDELLSALTQLGPRVIPPLLGALDAPDPDLRAAIIQVLGRVGTRDVAASLWHPAYAREADHPAGVRVAGQEALARIYATTHADVAQVSSTSAAKELERAALVHFRREHPWQPAEDGLVEVWVWNDEPGTVEAVRMTPDEASLAAGTRFARQSLSIGAEDTNRQALYLALALSAAGERAGGTQPLPSGPGTAFDLALSAGPDVVSRVLALSLEHRQVRAAVAALQVLARIASARRLLGTDAERSPILVALNDPHPRVQFAAALTVLQIDPPQRFPGAGRIVEILGRALNDSGVAAALVVHANPQAAGDVAGFMQQMGYGETYIAQTGREAFLRAAGQGDIELIVLNANVIRWPLSETIANLRADSRTAGLPIVIFGPEREQSRVQYLLRRDGLLTYVVESNTLEHFEAQARPFLDGLKVPDLTAPERAARAEAAAYWLGSIAVGRRVDLYDLAPAERALASVAAEPDVGHNALIAMSAIPTRTVQSRMQEVVVNVNAPLENRVTAATELAAHIRRHGVLLSDAELVALGAARQAASEPELATALAAAIGALRPQPAVVEQRLRSYGR